MGTIVCNRCWETLDQLLFQTSHTSLKDKLFEIWTNPTTTGKVCLYLFIIKVPAGEVQSSGQVMSQITLLLSSFLLASFHVSSVEWTKSTCHIGMYCFMRLTVVLCSSECKQEVILLLSVHSSSALFTGKHIYTNEEKLVQHWTSLFLLAVCLLFSIFSGLIKQTVKL